MICFKITITLQLLQGLCKVLHMHGSYTLQHGPQLQKSPAIIYSMVEISEKFLPFRIDRFPWLLHPKCKNGKLGLDQSKTKVKLPN